MKEKSRFLIIDIIGMILLITFDLITKDFAATSLKGNDPYVLVKGVFEFRYLENHGAAFSMFQDKQLFLSIIAFIAVFFILFMLYRTPVKRHYRLLRICLIGIAAGAAGNLIDRLFLGYVRDFLYFVLIDFPIFNVADIYVTCSVFLLVILILFYYKEDDFKEIRIHRK